MLYIECKTELEYAKSVETIKNYHFNLVLKIELKTLILWEQYVIDFLFNEISHLRIFVGGNMTFVKKNLQLHFILYILVSMPVWGWFVEILDFT